MQSLVKPPNNSYAIELNGFTYPDSSFKYIKIVNYFISPMPNPLEAPPRASK
jgi:hypothetical protein